MKSTMKLLLLAIMCFSFYNLNAQEDTRMHHYWQISPRIGYDIPTFKNNTPYIDYKGGMEFGISVDYYWRWFGFGLDYDNIKNIPESTYPTNFPFTAPADWATSEQKIKRSFIGIGPDFQHRSKNNRFTAEFNTRFGLSSIKGGRTALVYSPGGPLTLNYHAGYNDKSVFSFKGQLRFNYFTSKTQNFGIHAGMYYLKHFGVTELSETVNGTSNVSALYYPFSMVPDGSGGTVPQLDNAGANPNVRTQPCDCDISSIGLFAGVTFRIPAKSKACPVCGEVHQPFCCATCGCGVTVTAKDKFTGQTLPNTDVVLTDLSGNIVKTAVTNAYGVAVFDGVATDNYLIRGKLYNVTLDEGTISKKEFKDCKKNTAGIQKVILYTDENFILKGKVVECNETKGIQGVDVILRDKINAGQKNTLSNNTGGFNFHLKQASTYAIKGNKDGYFSNEVEVSTTSYDRNSTLFIDFEMCVDPCGKAIRLDNIIFNLAKWDILPAAEPDLQKVVKLMKENPGIMVEMSSHTDSRGSNTYNQDLSQKRAQSTVNYLISQGIDRSRLIARGAGETELLNRCADGTACSEDEHRINRRTEFKVVCP